MLVDEEHGGDGPADEVGPGEVQPETEGQQGGSGQDVHGAGDPEGGVDAETGGQRLDAVGAVEVHVADGVEDVEAGGERRDDGVEEDGFPCELAGDADPAAGGGDGEGHAEGEVGQPREALDRRVADDEEGADGGEGEGERVELPSGDEVEGKSGDGQRRELPGLQEPLRQVAVGGAGVDGVDAAVEDAVDGHAGVAGADHGEGDPDERLELGQAVGGEEHADVGEGQGEEALLELHGREDVVELLEGADVVVGYILHCACRSPR